MVISRMPSLLALRAFEAAARRLSFTAAAEELHVSQAAISRHVRSLEADLERPLFVRLHRRVQLTAVGQKLSAALTMNLAGIHQAVLQARGNITRALRLSVEPSFGTLWLAPRLGDFTAAHPHIELQLETSDSIRTPGPDADIAIRYVAAGSRRRGRQGERLFAMEAFPVTARPPRARAALAQDCAILNFRILHDDDGRTWRAWFRAAGLTFTDTVQQQYFTDYSLTLAAAERGQGATLGARPFVDAALSAGRLTRIGRTCVPFGAYWLLQSRDRRTADVRRSFRDWLLGELVPQAGRP